MSSLLGAAACSNPGDDDDSDSLGWNSSDDEEVVQLLENEAEGEMLINSSSGSSIRFLTLPDWPEKGLSSHYAGKARSFSDLSQCREEAANLAKVEHPFNKRRRMYIQSRLSYGRIGSASCNSMVRRERVLLPRSPRAFGPLYRHRQSFVEVDRREEVAAVWGRKEGEELKSDVDEVDNGTPFPCRLFDRY